MFLDEWIDITDYLYPTGYLTKIMAWMNSFQKGELIETEAFEKLKKLFLSTFPYVSREQTTEENEKIKHYLEMGLSDLI